MFTPTDDSGELASIQNNKSQRGVVNMAMGFFKSAVKKAGAEWLPLKEKLGTYRPRVRIYFEKDNYILKTAESSWELEAALRLRHDIFYREMLGKDHPKGIDMDRFDLNGDHLVILKKETGECVGTYRLMCSLFTEDFYSSTEFKLKSFLSLPGEKLELGRACIHKNHRTGGILSLLWRGIFQYLQKTKSAYLFGCTSIPTMSPVSASIISRYLHEKGYTMDGMAILPKMFHRFKEIPRFNEPLNAEDPAAVKKSKELISPLLLSYFRVGALVNREPALDVHFKCIDFLTVLESSKLNSSYERKFNHC